MKSEVYYLMATQKSSDQRLRRADADYAYEYCLVDPVTQGRYRLRTQRPKIKDQIEFHVKLALSGRNRAKAGEEMILYALEK